MSSQEVCTAGSQFVHEKRSNTSSLVDSVRHLEHQLELAEADVIRAKRRAQVDLEHARLYAVEDMAREILHVKDALETALRIETNDSLAVRSGLELILRRLETVLNRKDW